MDPIWSQLSQPDYDFLTSVAHALAHARSKYPGNYNRYVAFTGECGEAFYAFEKYIKGIGTAEELKGELVQAAAMACRLAVEGDAGWTTCKPEH
jgi:hypothetical protein